MKDNRTNLVKGSLGRLYRQYLEEGDLDALAKLFDELAPKLERIAKRLTRDEHSAGDALQETFLALVQRRGSLPPTSDLTSWIVGILIHKSRDVSRAAKEVPADLSAGQVLPPEQELAQTELGGSINEALSQLPSSLRGVVVGQLLEGASSAKLAAQHNITEGALRVRLHRGKQLLRRTLRPAAATWFGGLLAAWLGGPSSLASIRRTFLQEAQKQTGLLTSSSAATRVLAPKLAIGVGALAVAIGLGVALQTAKPADPIGVGPRVALEKSAPTTAAVESKATETRTIIAPEEEANNELATLTARVLDIGSGSPIAGRVVTVTSGPWASQIVHEATTTGDGLAVFELPMDTYVRRLETAPTETTTGAANWLSSDLDELEQEGNALLDLHIGAGGSISGVVLDAERQPVPFAEVRAWCRSQSRMDGEPDRVVTADGNGEFTLLHLGPEYVATARTKDLACSYGIRGEVAHGQVSKGAEIHVVESVTRTGVVVDPDGFPLAGAAVTARSGLSTRQVSDETSISGTLKFRAAGGSITTEADGRFHMEGLPITSNGVAAEKKPYLKARAFGVDDKEQAMIPITLQLGAGDVVTGLVLGPAGLPVEGASVHIFPYSKYGPGRATTGPDGRFRAIGMNFAGQPAKRVAITVLAKGHAVLFKKPIDLAAASQTLHLQPERPLTGRALDEKGRPLAGITISVESETNVDRGVHTEVPATWEGIWNVYQVETDSQGRFSFPHLNPGPLTLHVGHTEHKYPTFAVPISRGQTQVDIVASDESYAMASFHGRVTDAISGEPIPGASIWAYWDDPLHNQDKRADDNDEQGGRVATTDEEGAYSAFGIPIAGLEIHTSAKGYTGPFTGDVSVPSGDHKLDFKLLPQRSLQLRFRDAKGAPTYANELRVLGSDGEPVFLGSHNSMRTSRMESAPAETNLHGLPAEPVTIQVTRAGYQQEIPVDLTNELQEPLVITLIGSNPNESVDPVTGKIVTFDPETNTTTTVDPLTGSTWTMTTGSIRSELIVLLAILSEPLTEDERKTKWDIEKGICDKDWFLEQAKTGRFTEPASKLTIRFFDKDNKPLETKQIKPSKQGRPFALARSSDMYPEQKIRVEITSSTYETTSVWLDMKNLEKEKQPPLIFLTKK